MSNKKFLSTTQVAALLGISRISVFNKIKKGEIKAIKVGRNYIIETDDVIGENLTEEEKRNISVAVDRTVSEYGEVLRKLGRNDD